MQGKSICISILREAGSKQTTLAPVAEGDPETVFAVDGHAVGDGWIVPGVPDDAFSRDGTGGNVEIEGADLFTRGVDVVHRLSIAAPDDAVGVGDGAEFFFETKICVEAVERGIRALLQANGPRPEAAGGIALAVVEAVVGEIGLGIGDGGAGAGGFVEKEQAFITCPDQAAARAWNDGADALADVPDLLDAGGRCEGEDLVGFDIDVEQPVLMPERSFAPGGDVVGNRFG